MMQLSQTAEDFAAYVLGTFARHDLTETERHAAVTLLATLPSNTTLQQFIAAASPENVARAGLPDTVAADLQPVLSALELNLSYAGRYAALFEHADAKPHAA